jgi:hypothetical protein
MSRRRSRPTAAPTGARDRPAVFGHIVIDCHHRKVIGWSMADHKFEEPASWANQDSDGLWVANPK